MAYGIRSWIPIGRQSYMLDTPYQILVIGSKRPSQLVLASLIHYNVLQVYMFIIESIGYRIKVNIY